MRQKRNYQEKTRNLQFKRGDWVWKACTQLVPGKLRNKNEGPWLILSKVGEVYYRIQRTKGEEPQVVHVDKLVPYYPDFDTVLTPWITMESGPRNTGTQTDDTLRVPGADTRGKRGGSGSATIPAVQVVIEETQGQEKWEEASSSLSSSQEVSLITNAVMSEGTGEQPVLRAKRSSEEGWPKTILSWCKNWGRDPGSVTRVN